MAIIPDALVIEGTDGNFYGTTSSGGANQGGIAFKVTSAGVFTDLYDFCSDPNSDDSVCKDGIAPNAGLVQGTDGNFYGTTSEGGLSDSYNSGVIFKLTPAGNITVLHSFAGTDGGDPFGQLIQGSDGNFYGTTFVGGAHNAGTIFKITSGGVFTLLFSFDQAGNGDSDVNGENPLSGLVQGANGNFYGSASEGGVGNFGTNFSITPGGAINLLYSFDSSSDNSSTPSGLVESSDGNFYGAGAGGGDSYPAGNIYEMTPGGAVTVVYSYGGNFDGNQPLAPPVQGSDGNLYGTTKAGGAIGGGIVYKLTVSPALAPPVQLTAPSSVAGGRKFRHLLSGRQLVCGKGAGYAQLLLRDQYRGRHHWVERRSHRIADNSEKARHCARLERNLYLRADLRRNGIRFRYGDGELEQEEFRHRTNCLAEPGDSRRVGDANGHGGRVRRDPPQAR